MKRTEIDRLCEIGIAAMGDAFARAGLDRDCVLLFAERSKTQQAAMRAFVRAVLDAARKDGAK